MPRSKPAQAPGRIAKWLDELKQPMVLRPYADLDAVAARLTQTNPRLRPDRAAWLASQWSRPVGSDAAGARALLADPNHKRTSPLLAQVDEWLECWKRITAPVLWVEGDRSDLAVWWGDRYSKPEFHRRLDVVADAERHVVGPAGHMLHHDQPRGHRPADRGVPVRIAPSAQRLELKNIAPWTSNTSMPSATALPT